MAELTVTKDKILLKGVKDFGSPFVLVGAIGNVEISSSMTTKAFFVGNGIERVLSDNDSIQLNGEFGLYGEETTFQSLSLTGDMDSVKVMGNRDLKVLSIDSLELNDFEVEGSLIEDLRLKAVESGKFDLSLNEMRTLSYLLINLPSLNSLNISNCTLMRELHLFNYNNSVLLLNSLISLRVIELINTGIIDLDLSNNEQLDDLTVKSSDVSDIKIPKSLKFTNIGNCNNLTMLDFSGAALFNDAIITNCDSLSLIILKGTSLESNEDKLRTLINSLNSRIGLSEGEIIISDQSMVDSVKDLAIQKNWIVSI